MKAGKSVIPASQMKEPEGAAEAHAHCPSHLRGLLPRPPRAAPAAPVAGLPSALTLLLLPLPCFLQASPAAAPFPALGGSSPAGVFTSSPDAGHCCQSKLP